MVRLGSNWFSSTCLGFTRLGSPQLGSVWLGPSMIWTSAEILVPTGIRSRNVQLSNQSLYQLSYRAHSFSLYTQQWYISYRFADILRAWSWSRSQAVSKPVWHTPLLCVQWKIPDYRLRKFPKYVVSIQNIFWKFSVSVWFYYNDLSRCMVSWTSNVSINNVQNTVEMWWNTVTHGREIEGQNGQRSG